MNGVTIHAEQNLDFARAADEIARDTALLERIQFDPKKQLIGAQASQYLAAWILLRGASAEDAEAAGSMQHS